jgi:dipeptidyl aminopeptidase/acylaminoacyl peptidase
MRRFLLLLTLGFFMTESDATGQATYLRPPQAITDILDAPPPPSVSVSPTRDTMALLTSARYPAVAELAEPILRLAGVRFNPRTNGPARESRITAISLLPIAGGDAKPVKLPEGRVTGLLWADDGKRFALTVTTPTGIDLYLGDLAGTLTKLPVGPLNGVIGTEVQWVGSTKLLAQTVPPNRGPAPVAPLAPTGPVVQQSSGKAAPVRTYQDLLTNAHDEALFTHYATSQLVLIDVGRPRPISYAVGAPAIFASVAPSPEFSAKPGLGLLLVSRVHGPYSYLYPVSAFPRVTEAWQADGKVIAVIHDAPLEDKVPIEGVPTGPRGVRWVPTAPATLMWAEALDGGDPKAKVTHRDELFTRDLIGGEKTSVLKVEHRYRGASFFESDDALVTDYDRERRWSRTVRVNFGKTKPQSVIFDRSVQDRYGDPGSPLTKMLPNGERVVRTLGDKIVVSSEGANPKGDLPFLGVYDPATKVTEKVFTCREGVYETVAAVLSDDLKKLLIRRESPTEPGNYYLRDGDKETQLTRTTDPFPELRKVTKQLVTTKRPDGVTISFTLYVPAGVKPGEKLPTVFWAYPKEFNDAATAGQVSGSQSRFVTPAGYSHLFFLTQGYAVMDEVSMPIVGPPETANDNFLEQLVSTAKAAIDKAAEVGPVDPTRVGVGGHSYGAFMTANLLAHSDLFRAGIARSGAYNRTLTPFGFQNERRTFWEAPQIYATMSPFNSAHKINEPLLMIHGQADSNPGTFPVQSERLYQAVRGNGGTVRLVLLPHEDHGYAARESIGHVLAEQLAWFDKYVKGAAPR